MIAIKGIEIPKNCVECNNIGLQQIIGCELICSGCANCGRHPNCPLVEIVTCKDCKHCKKDVTEGEKLLWCKKDGFATSEGYYCGSGKRE